VLEESDHVPEHVVGRVNRLVPPLVRDEPLDDRLELVHLAGGDHQLLLACPQPGVGREVHPHAPRPGLLGQRLEVAEVVAVHHRRQRDGLGLIRPEPLHQRRDSPEQPRDATEVVVAFVGEVERQRELVHAGLPQPLVPLPRQQEAVGRQHDERGAVGDADRGDDVVDVGPEQGLAARYLRHHRFEAPGQLAEPLRGGPDFPGVVGGAPEVAVAALGVAVVGDLERDTEGPLRQQVGHASTHQ